MTYTTSRYVTTLSLKAIEASIALDRKIDPIVTDSIDIVDAIAAHSLEAYRITALLAGNVWSTYDWWASRNADVAIAAIDWVTAKLAETRTERAQFARFVGRFYIVTVLLLDWLLNLAFATEYETVEPETVLAARRIVLRTQRKAEAIAQVTQDQMVSALTPLNQVPSGSPWGTLEEIAALDRIALRGGLA